MDILMLASAGFALLDSSCISSINSFLTAPYTAWFPVATLAVLASIGVLSIIYAIAPLIGSMSAIRSWIKVKVYELLLAIVLILIFASIGTALCAENPVGFYNSVGLVANQCKASGNLYTLALCNMYQFNNYVGQFVSFTYYASVIFSIQPNLLISLNLNLGSGLVSSNFNVFGRAGVQVTGDIGPLELSPIQKSNKFESFAIPAIYLFILINNVQLLLLSAAPYLFAFFMALGLITRAFGVTRTFGGALIAFGIGFGFMYPMMTSLTYGFLDHVLQQPGMALAFGTPGSPILTAINTMAGLVSGGFPSMISNPATYIPEMLFVYIGTVVTGVIFINILNFIILDAFIADLSAAVGERMDFMSLLTNII